MQWCSGAICPESCKGIQGEPERMQEYTTTTSTPTEYTHGTQDTTTGKRATTSIKIKFAYIIGIIAPNDKKMKKKLKKIWKFNFLPYLCSRNQKTNNIMTAILEIRIFLAFCGIIVLAGCTVAAIIAIHACKADE